MGLIVIDLDIKNLPLEDFMQALGYKPIKRESNRLSYNAPYSADRNATMVVDTEKNGWYDSKEPEKYCGGIYDLAYELTGSCNRSELNLYIATQMKGLRDFKTYGVTANGGKAEGNVVVAMPVGKSETSKGPATVERPKSKAKIDINDIPIADFMKAIGYRPLKQDGKLLMYDCPYAVSEPIRTVVDTEKNYWYDTEDDLFCGGIYSLAAEITYKESRADLTRYIATQMKNLEQYKSCEFKDRYERPGAKELVIGFTISDPGLPKHQRKADPPKESPRQKQQQPPKPKRKMRF